MTKFNKNRQKQDLTNSNGIHKFSKSQMNKKQK